MSWRDKLQEASFRGIKFSILSSDHEFGRRTELKQYANNDGPVIQDFGEDASEFSIEAFVIASVDNGFDYFIERDALISAFKEMNVGILVHPYYGQMEVYPVGRAKISETTDEGGIARITMKFVRVNEADNKMVLPSYKKQLPNVTEPGMPTESKDFNAIIDNAVSNANNEAMDNFSSLFSTSRSFVDKLINGLTTALQKMQAAVFNIRGTISSVVATVNGTISTVLANLNNIISAPCLMFNDIKTACDSFASICGVGLEGVYGGMIGACSGLVRGELTELDGETIPEELGKSSVDSGLTIAEELDEADFGFIPASQKNNIIAVIDTFKFCIYGATIKTAIRTSFMNQEELIEYADKIAASLDSFLLRLGAEKDEANYEYIEGDFLDNSMLYAAMEDLRNIFIQAMYAKAGTLSRLIEYQITPEIMNVLQVAYDKYEDLEREDEITTTNRDIVLHPGFLPTGKSIKVLNE